LVQDDLRNLWDKRAALEFVDEILGGITDAPKYFRH